MPRPVAALLLAVALLSLSVPACAAEAAPVLSDEPCEAPFVLTVTADAVRARGGLAVVLHDDGAGQHVVFDVGLQAVTVTLRRKGQATPLGRAAVALPGAGRAVVLKRLPEGFAVAYDAVTVLRGKAELPNGGRWGLLNAPAAVLGQVRMQPTDHIQFSDDFMRSAADASLWETQSGQWRVAQLESARYSANAFTFVGRATDAKPALTTTGYWFWEDLTVEASVRPSPGAAGFGLSLASQPDGPGYLLRFLPQASAGGTLQLVRVRGAQETVLKQAPAAAPTEDWHRLTLSGVAGRLAGTLDGVELVSAPAPELAHGKVGLWVAGAQPVAFDDVEAYSGPRETQRPVVLSYEAQASDPGAQAFIRDQYMQEWADERDQWLPGGGGIWHGGTYWGDVTLSWELAEGGLRTPLQLHVCVPPGADTISPPADATAGCHLDVTPADGGQLALTLREGQQSRAQKTVAAPEASATIALRRAGQTLEALVGGEMVASCPVTAPAAGKVGCTGPGAYGQAGRLAIGSQHVIDSTFRAAPTDWTIGSGEWGVASRWACTPRWSWFQGRSRDLASIWTRRHFTGDVVVEFFAAISMDQPWAPFYRHPGNLAVTLCGADGTPGSGYSLIFAGWGNTAAGIYRRGELVAQVPGVVMPDIVDSLGGAAGHGDAHKLHNEWRRLRAERSGDTVRLLVDGRLAASYKDPAPLPGGTVGIWTLDQAITVARARIYYQAGEDVLSPAPAAASPATTTALPLPSDGPPRAVSTFERGLDGWKEAVPGSCALTVGEREAPVGGRCLRATNPSAGGRFALAAPFAGLDLRTHPALVFDYAVPAEARVDVFATVASQRYRIVLNGPPEPMPGLEDVGRVPDALADGQWHTAQVDLLGLLEPATAGARPLVLQALEFAAYAAPGYLRAGIGGNPAGASWRLDNVYLGGVTASPAVAATPTDLLVSDTAAPVLEALAPQAGATWLGPVLSVSLRDRGPAGISASSLEVRSGPSGPAGNRRFGVADRALRWRPATGTLSLDLRAANLTLPPGQPVSVTVNAADRAGNKATPLQFTFTPQTRADTTPPDPPILAGLPPARVDCDFETDLGPVEPWGPDAGVALRRAGNPVAGNPRGGDWCLEARATKLGGLYGVSLGVTPFEASRLPVLEFDYRAPRELRVDLIVTVGGTRRTIKFTDNDQTWPIIGAIGATADDRWHHAAVDLQGMLARAYGRSAPLVVTDLAFASAGWPGTREGLCWWLDNLRLSAALNTTRLPDGLQLTARDESGIAALCWSVDTSPSTEPPAAATTTDLRAALAAHPGTLAWLHAAAVDQAGNRSQASHVPLRLMTSDDTTPPVVSAPTPADGVRACPGAITVKIADAGAGVSPADLRLTVNGRTWTVADTARAWDAALGQLTWSLPAGMSLGANGARVACRVDAADLAGNVALPLNWSFTLDHARDEQPPAAPAVSYVPARRADSNDFEADSGGWGNFLASQILRLGRGGATGPGCLELRYIGVGEQANGFVLVRDFGEGWRDTPLVRFRYRAVKAPYASFEIYGTTFDGAGESWTPLGSFPASGDQWQTAELDLAQALTRANPRLDIHRIFLSITLPLDGALLIDDYAMYSAAATQASFRWAAPVDASGISGYAWVLDANAATVPPEKITGTALQADCTGLKPGAYTFHVRACDGAGHWGPASHVPVVLTAPAAR